MFAHSILTATSTRSKIEKENTKKNQYLQFTNAFPALKSALLVMR